MPVVATSMALVVALGAAIEADAGPRAPDERVSVRRARVPVVFDERRPAGCAGIDPSGIVVTLDGDPVEVVRVDRPGGSAGNGSDPREATVHALVLDTSPSMLRRLDEFREAARAYADALPPGDAVLLASLDDRLVLRHDPTSDPDAIDAALDALRPGRGTALWLALDELLTYLESYSGRKIVAIVTDGCDHRLPNGPGPDEVAALAARARGLTVFPVATDAPVRCPGTPPVDPRMRLYPLARVTGGETIEVRNDKPLRAGLRRIRERLDREGALTWVPPPSPSAVDRRLDVRAAPGSTCDVGLAVSGRVPGAGTSDREARVDARLNARGDRMVGTIGTASDPAVRVDAPVPAIRDLERGVDLASVLADEIVRLGTFAGTHGADPPGPVVPGSALLRSRDAFAAALYARADYRAWARDRIARRRVDRLAAAAGVDDAPAVAAYRDALAGGSWDPEPWERRAVLAAWVGDVDVGSVVAAVDLALARRALARSIDPAVIRAGWRRLRDGLRPLDDRAELGLLVPTRGGAADVVGFVRIVLPIDSVLRPDRTGVPEDAFAALAVHEIARRMPGSLTEIRGARYHAVSRGETRAIRRALRRGGRDERIDRDDLRAVALDATVGGDAETMVAWFRVGSSVPTAWTIPADGAIRRTPAARGAGATDEPVSIDVPASDGNDAGR